MYTHIHNIHVFTHIIIIIIIIIITPKQTNQPTTKRENIFISNVSAARNEELKNRRYVKSWYAVMTMVSRAVPIVVTLVGLGLYDVVFPGQLTAGKIFPSSP